MDDNCQIKFRDNSKHETTLLISRYRLCIIETAHFILFHSIPMMIPNTHEVLRAVQKLHQRHFFRFSQVCVYFLAIFGTVAWHITTAHEQLTASWISWRTDMQHRTSPDVSDATTFTINTNKLCTNLGGTYKITLVLFFDCSKVLMGNNVIICV